MLVVGHNLTHVVPAGLGEVVPQHLVRPQSGEPRELEVDTRSGSLEDLLVGQGHRVPEEALYYLGLTLPVESVPASSLSLSSS